MIAFSVKASYNVRESMRGRARTEKNKNDGGRHMKPFLENLPLKLFVGDICDHPYPAHVHDVVEIVCVTQGSVTLVISGDTWTLAPGDVAVVFPNVAHSYEEVSGDIDGLAAIFRTDTIAEFEQRFKDYVPEVPILRAKNVNADVPGIIQKLKSISVRPEHPLRTAYLHLLLAYLLTDMNMNTATASVEQTLFIKAIRYIVAHYTEPIALQNVAEHLNISRTYLSHLFADELHINFRRYINSVRINKARDLLREKTLTITDICYRCGYDNARTFNRAFAQECGMPPNAYRRYHEKHGWETLRAELPNTADEA